MKNLKVLMYPIAVTLWMLIFWQCSIALVKLQGFPLKLTAPTDQKATIKRLEENRLRVISLGKQSISIAPTHATDGLSLQRCKRQDLPALGLPKRLYTSIQTKTNRKMSSGHISDTVGRTTINLWNN